MATNDKYVSDVALKDKPIKRIGLRIKEGSITNPKIADGAVTADKIADNAIEGRHIVDDSIEARHILDNSIPGEKIKDGTIENVDIKDGTLSGEKLKDNTLEGSKLKDNIIESRHLKDNSIGAEKIKDGTIESVDIKDGTLSGGKIKDNTIQGTKLADGAVDENKLVDNSITTAKIAPNAVTEDKIKDNSVTNAKIASNAVTTAKIGDGEVTEGKLADGAVTTEKLATPVIEQLQTIMDDVPTAGSVKPINSEGVLAHGSAFDVSEYNKSEGVLATYETLAAALDAVPATSKRGGMSIKFVLRTNTGTEEEPVYADEYVQYRLMSTDWSNVVSDWQGVDSEPVAGGRNMINSGGVEKELPVFKFVGNANTTVFSSYYNHIKTGNTYRAWIKNPNINPAGVTSGNKFVVFGVDEQEQRTVIFAVAHIVTTPYFNAFYDFSIPDGCVSILLGIKAAKKETVDIVLEDVTAYASINSLLFKPITEFNEVNYTISANNAFGTNAAHKHACIPVNPEEVYRIKASDFSVTTFCFATSSKAVSGGAIPLVEGTMVYSIAIHDSITVSIPKNCTYLLVYNGSDARPFNVSKFAEYEKNVCCIYPKLTFDYIRGLSGDFAAHENNFKGGNYLSTPRFIKTPDKFTCTVSKNCTGLTVIYYDKDFNYISYTGYTDIIADTPIEVNQLGGYSYVKLCLQLEENVAFEIVRVKLVGTFDVNWDVFNVRPSNGYHRIAVHVNISDAKCSDGITGNVQDSLNYRPNYGVIALPTTYNNTGKPTRLIIYCHGAGTHFTFSNSTGFDTSKHVDPTYWLAEGYAVMDIDGNPMDDTAHAFRPQAMNAYIAAYKWAIEHYNLCRDGVLLGGRSMGGGNTMYLLRSTCSIPVIAACANHPTSVAMNKTGESKLSIANMRGFIIPEGFTFSDGVMTDADTQVYYDNWEKAIRYIPSIALCVDTPTTEEWRKNFIKNCCHVDEPYESNRIAACKDLHMIVRAPFKMFGCFEDPNNGYQATAQLYMTMLGNAGQQAEYRLFHSDKNTNYPDDSRTEHYYELADPTLRVNKTTIFGEELSNVPVVYIEMLQFWRRYEQSN